jgi:hypothetical protein
MNEAILQKPMISLSLALLYPLISKNAASITRCSLATGPYLASVCVKRIFTTTLLRIYNKRSVFYK